MTRDLRSALPVAALLVALLMLAPGCRTMTPDRTPLGEHFPDVLGKSLAGDETRLPQALKGQVAILLVGYTRRSQFDIDRWILGLTQLETPARVMEVPTVGGLFTRLFGERLDESMRGGIPEEDWPAVVTVYAEAEKITDFLGTTERDNARVVLLDPDGVVCWVEARGYSASLVSALDAEARALTKDATTPSPAGDSP